MKSAGLDADNDAHAKKYHIQKWQHFQQATRKIILGSHPDALLYHTTAVQANILPNGMRQ